jgi:putative hydrolase of the HAD superfamily
MVRAIVLDLDDTLYLERDYIRSGFRAVASFVQHRSGLDQDQISGDLWKLFEGGLRGNTFNCFLQNHSSLRDKCEISDLVQIYRHHVPQITFLPHMQELLAYFKEEGTGLALITDGPPVSQKAKVKALDLERYLSSIIITDERGIEFRKPHLYGFEKVMEAMNLPAKRIVYVADNPEKDFFGPRRLGWQSIRLKLDEQLRCKLKPRGAEDASDVEVHSVLELRSQLLKFAHN